jgi:hypothetical protein
MPAAMSIHCINMPPKIVPCVFVNPGSTSCSVSTRDERGVRFFCERPPAALAIAKSGITVGPRGQTLYSVVP